MNSPTNCPGYLPAQNDIILDCYREFIRGGKRWCSIPHTYQEKGYRIHECEYRNGKLVSRIDGPEYELPD